MPEVLDKEVIIDQLIHDIQKKFNSDNLYKHPVKQLLIGSSLDNDFTVYPAISLWPFDDPIEKRLMGRTYICNFIFYADLLIPAGSMQNIKGYKPIFEFENDFNRFIRSSDWTYNKHTIWVRSGPFYVGGVHDKIQQTRVEFHVQHIE